MITKQQYKEILNATERFLKIKQILGTPMSQDYQFGFLAAMDVIKSLVKNE